MTLFHVLFATLLAFALCAWDAPGADASEIVVRNQTGRTYFCTIQGEGAMHPQAQAFIFPGNAFKWSPPRSGDTAWRVSVIHDDNGLTAGDPLRMRLEGTPNELCIKETPSGPSLSRSQNHAQNGEPEPPGQ